MSTLTSSVLIICHPDPQTVVFGADFAQDVGQAREKLTVASYPVIAIPSDLLKSDEDWALLDEINEDSPLSQRVVIHEGDQTDQLRKLINKGHVFKILPSFTDLNFDRVMQEALDEYMFAQQNARLLQVVGETNDRLKRLTTDLEDRVQKREAFLQDTRAKLLVTNHRVEALHRALVAVHRASSLAEMERLINEALTGAMGLMSTRILFQSQGAQTDQLKSHEAISVFSAPLTDSRQPTRDAIGTVNFVRQRENPFTRDETAFLTQVADAVSLATDRLLKLEQSETLKAQWDATFDAILEPVSLIDENYTLLRTNRAFAESAGSTPARIIGRKCFEVLFDRQSPCAHCKLGENFRLDHAMLKPGDITNEQRKSVTFEVYSQTIQFNPGSKTLFVNMYRDVSEQIRMERQVVESAKMAELGTIGSSIAHELNNPLGGILSFLQLIQMDLKGDESYADDVNEMEKGARRCRDIVQNLLGFTRKSASYGEVQIVDLREVIQQALKITELQTRAMGITVLTDLPSEAVMMQGQMNDLAQAIRGFLQNAQEGIAARAANERFDGQITLRLSNEEIVNEDRMTIEIIDNGAGPGERATSLGLTVAVQIITDHAGRLETFAQTLEGTQAKISFPRPV